MCRRSSVIRLNASECVRPSVPDISLMSRHNCASIRKCVFFPNIGQVSAILLELLGRKLLQYFQVSKVYYLTLIQESYTVCGYKFLPYGRTRCKIQRRPQNTHRGFSDALRVPPDKFQDNISN